MKLTNKILIPSLSIMIISFMVISIISAELIRNTARDLTDSKIQNIAESVNTHLDYITWNANASPYKKRWFSCIAP